MAKTVGNTTGQPNDITVATGSGATDGDTQRVLLATDDPAVTSLAVIDDWDESDRAKVNPIVGQAGIAGGSSTRGATTTRVTIATDDEAVASLSVMDDWDDSDAARVTFSRTRVSVTPTIDTAVYADPDRVGTVGTVSNAARANGRSGIIVAAQLIDDAASNFSLEAHFFQVSPTMANADNGVFDLSDANIATAVWLGCIDFWSANSKVFTSNRVTQGTYLGGAPSLHYTCAGGDSAIYFVLRARGAYDAAATDDLVVHLELLRF